MLRINARMNDFARMYAIKTNARVERDSGGFHAHAELSSKHVQVRRMRRWEEFFHNNVENAGVLNCDNWTREPARLILRLFFLTNAESKASKSEPKHYNTNFNHEFEDSVLGGRAKKAFPCNHLFVHLLTKKFLPVKDILTKRQLKNNVQHMKTSTCFSF